jgi:N-acetylglutamate synthase/N-acetylornithine aminotransferase
VRQTAFLLQVLINAGQANAATGDAGYQDCLESAKAVSEALGISPDEVLLLSTGVIGRRIKLDALKDSVPKLASSLGSSLEDAHHAAVAITTTDLVSKSAALEVCCKTVICGLPKSHCADSAAETAIPPHCSFRPVPDRS